MANPEDSLPLSWDASYFRDRIRYVYEMAAPPEEEQQATFLFASQLVYTGEGQTDADGRPFDPTEVVENQVPDPVRVPCAVTYYDARGEITNFGVISPSRVSIDLLDEDYEQVKDAVAVVVGGEKFIYRRRETPSGLFDVGLYTLWFDAENSV